MILLRAKGVKHLKFIHLIFVISWVGAAVIMFVISLSETLLLKNNLSEVYLILDIIDKFAVIPAAIGTFLTGIVYGLFTNWGFFKFLGSLLLQPLILKNMGIVLEYKDLSGINPVFLNNEAILHTAGKIQLVLFLFVCYISVIKPWNKP
ncbi:MAG: hypothetical protein ABSG94_11945 [Brevinematales bacterium]